MSSHSHVYPALKILQLSCPFDRLEDLVSGSFPAKHGLRALSLVFGENVDEIEVSETPLCRQLPLHFPDLHHLHFDTFDLFGSLSVVNTIHPFTSCSKLTELSIFPLSMGSDEIICLTRSWPN